MYNELVVEEGLAADPLTVIVRPSLQPGVREAFRQRVAGIFDEVNARRNYLQAVQRLVRLIPSSASENECWIWPLSLNDGGYGSIGVGGKSVRSHRFSYEVFVGSIPEGLVIDHLCRNRACFNPRHLEAVTQAVNLERSGATEVARAAKRAKSHCKRDHPLSGENVRIDEHGRRRCATCIRNSANAGYHRRKELSK